MPNDEYMVPDFSPVQQQRGMMENPFLGVGGSNLPPNVPMPSDSPQMLTALHDDSTVNKKLKREFFWVFARDNALTFLDEERKQSKMITFDILKIDSLNSMAWYDYDFDSELKWNIMRNSFETKLDRALGTTNSQQKNERTVEQSQFTESRAITQHEDPLSYQREGFIKRLLRNR